LSRSRTHQQAAKVRSIFEGIEQPVRAAREDGVQGAECAVHGAQAGIGGVGVEEEAQEDGLDEDSGDIDEDEAIDLLLVTLCEIKTYRATERVADEMEAAQLQAIDDFTQRVREYGQRERLRGGLRGTETGQVEGDDMELRCERRNGGSPVAMRIVAETVHQHDGGLGRVACLREQKMAAGAQGNARVADVRQSIESGAGGVGCSDAVDAFLHRLVSERSGAPQSDCDG